MSDSELQPPQSRIPADVRLRIVALAGIVVAGVIAYRWTPLGDYLTSGDLLTALEAVRHSFWAPFALMGLYLVLCPIGLPVSPLMLIGGAVFGMPIGAIYNVFGALLGAFATFGVARMLGGGMVQRLLPPGPLKKMERLLERHSFWSLIRIRFVPIPFPIVNYGSALAGVPWTEFLITTLIGVTPSTILYSWAIATVVDAAAEQRGTMIRDLSVVLTSLVLLSLIPALLRMRARRRRYGRILETRRRDGRNTRS